MGGCCQPMEGTQSHPQRLTVLPLLVFPSLSLFAFLSLSSSLFFPLLFIFLQLDQLDFQGDANRMDIG